MGFMRTLYGVVVPDGARMVEVRAITSSANRPRTIFRGPIEEGGVLLTEDAIADSLAGDSKFWDWVSAQIRQRRIPTEQNGDGSVVRLRLSVSFINQDASPAILDDTTGATSFATAEAWEFYRGTPGSGDPLNPMFLIHQFSQLIIEQQKDMPNQVSRMLKEVVEVGKSAIQTSAAESAKIIQASVEPLKSQLTLIEKSHTHESTRADRASDAVIRMLMSESKDKDPVSEPEKLIGFLTALLALAEKGKKVLN